MVGSVVLASAVGLAMAAVFAIRSYGRLPANSRRWKRRNALAFTLNAAIVAIAVIAAFGVIGNNHLVPSEWVLKEQYQLQPFQLDGQNIYVTKVPERNYEDGFLIYRAITVYDVSWGSVGTGYAFFHDSADGTAYMEWSQIQPKGWWKLISLGGRDHRKDFYLPPST